MFALEAAAPAALSLIPYPLSPIPYPLSLNAVL